MARYHTCCRDRRNHTTVFEDELDTIIVANMNDAPSQNIPRQMSVHNAQERGNGERTHSPLTFRAAAMTSAGT